MIELDFTDLDACLAGKSPKAKGTKAKGTKAPKAKAAPFRELKAPPIRQPARGWSAVPPAVLAHLRWSPDELAKASYRPEHMLGQFPPIPLRGPSIHSL